ncbi:MAG: hypothetical protein F6K42_32565 [Leptolyngbya sp. SIO1D8]|nr:hypothetical protein [Leptolyngbya sp. SIO1D8]
MKPLDEFALGFSFAPELVTIMTQDITRWLTEIRLLQQQLASTRQERDQAYKSASSWRQLYEAEAKQRREDVQQLQLTVKTLRTELSTLATPQMEATLDEPTTEVKADLNTVEGLRTHLVSALQHCDRLQKALDDEQASHAETRKTLTTALGEAIDALSPDQAALVRQTKGSELKSQE